MPLRDKNLIPEQVEYLKSLSVEELRSWLIKLLRGTDTLLEQDDENSRAYPLTMLCRYLPPIVERRIHEVATSILGDWINGEVDGEVGENLLLLIQGMQITDARDKLEALSRGNTFAALPAELRYRVLQTLIALEANLEPGFWHRMYALDPSEMAGVVFDGVALVSPNHAVDFLCIVTDENPKVIRDIEIGLPGFMDNLVPAADRASVRDLIESRLSEMSPGISKVLADFFAREETPINFLPLEGMTEAAPVIPNLKITSESFPVLTALGRTLEEIFISQPRNPAREFIKLAYQ